MYLFSACFSSFWKVMGLMHLAKEGLFVNIETEDVHHTGLVDLREHVLAVAIYRTFIHG